MKKRISDESPGISPKAHRARRPGGGSTLRPEFRGEHLMHATHNVSMSYKARLLTEEGE